MAGETPTPGTPASRALWATLNSDCVEAERDAVYRMLRRGEINDRTGQVLYSELTLGQAILESKRRHS